MGHEEANGPTDGFRNHGRAGPETYSFLCRRPQPHEDAPALKPADAKYGAYYLSASPLNHGDESAALLLWTKEGANSKMIASVVELP